jgi:hypothetical protein
MLVSDQHAGLMQIRVSKTKFFITFSSIPVLTMLAILKRLSRPLLKGKAQYS